MTCMCESFRPGMTVRPATSMTCVLAPRSFSTSASVPTARNRPPFTATALAIVPRWSSVATRPFFTIRSAVPRSASWLNGREQPDPTTSNNAISHGLTEPLPSRRAAASP